MKTRTALHALIGVIFVIILTEVCSAAKRDLVLSRRRRYLVFPEGSTFNAAFCMSNKAHFPGDMGIWTEGVAWGLSYDLPNNTLAVASVGAGLGPVGPGSRAGSRAGAAPAEGRRRRERRDLFRKIEIAAESTGMDGRACMLRLVCEGQQLLAPRQNVLHEVLRTILAVPMGMMSQSDPAELREYVAARRHGVSGLDCTALYPECSVSLLSMLLSLSPIKPFSW